MKPAPESLQKLYCKSPCKNCPYRKDSLEGWLGHRIENDIKTDTFVCHKDNSKQCAGHMLLRKNNNAFYNLAQIMGYDLELKNEKIIFDNEQDCINHHKKSN